MPQELHVSEITSKEDWESFSPLVEKGIFLQSWNAKRLAESLGQRTWLLRLSNAKAQVGQTLVTLITAKRGTFLYLPYGPILVENNTNAFSTLVQYLKKLGQEHHASFIRVSPYLPETGEFYHLFRSEGFRKAPIHMLAETLWILPLTGRTEESLLSAMEKKHRNLIRRAEKEGVKIISDNSEKSIREFIDLHLQTVDRHKFTPYPKDYFRNQVKLYQEDGQALIMSAQISNETLASGIFMYYGKGGFYHHGASSSAPEHRKIPASYLLQWAAIKEAMARKCDFYSFWGIAPFHIDISSSPSHSEAKEGQRVYSNPNHPFVGITHFKTGFGGHREDLLPCMDLPLSKRYWLNWLIESVRRWRRGF